MSARVGVVACSKLKASGPCAAVDLYRGRTFRAAVALLRARGAERVIILSALHGPVWDVDVIAPYEASLIGAKRAELRAWEAMARPRLVAMLGALEGVQVEAIVPRDYARALADVPHARLFEGLSQGRLFSSVVSELRARGGDL